MKILFLGGTGTISMAITRLLAERGHELYLINRGNRKDELPANVNVITADINNEKELAQKTGELKFDSICDFICFNKEQAERDYRLFRDKTSQFIFISSASAYQKPLSSHIINEGTTLSNPYWEYSRNKIACEEFFIRKHSEEGFPITIVRPSHTYDNRSIPLGVHGKKGSWQVAKRMLEGKTVIIHGDGTSLWTMTHNSDFARGFAGLVGNIHAIGEAFQITSDEVLSWNQIYQTIANALGVKLNACHVSSEFLHISSGEYDLLGSLTGDKANSVIFDCSKLKRFVPDFVATKRFDQGIRETIENILSHKELQQEDPEFDAWCDRVIKARAEAIQKVRGSF